MLSVFVTTGSASPPWDGWRTGSTMASPKCWRDFPPQDFGCSSRRRSLTSYSRRIVEHFGIASHFAGHYGSELDGTRTNKGELISFLLESEGLDPDATLMVGDREHDLIGLAQSVSRQSEFCTAMAPEPSWNLREP